jgi:hypothetical protein
MNKVRSENRFTRQGDLETLRSQLAEIRKGIARQKTDRADLEYIIKESHEIIDQSFIVLAKAREVPK